MIFAKKKKTKNVRYIDCNLGSVYFLDWIGNPGEWESQDWECGVGVGVGCLLTLEWKHGLEIRIQFMCLLCLGLGVNSFKL